jgi:hypothetical protein
MAEEEAGSARLEITDAVEGEEQGELALESSRQQDSELLDEGDSDAGPQEGDEYNFNEMPEFAHLPPMDPWRRVKRDVLKFINLTRNEELETETETHVDFLLSDPAVEYANFVLDDMEDETKL